MPEGFIALRGLLQLDPFSPRGRITGRSPLADLSQLHRPISSVIHWRNAMRPPRFVCLLTILPQRNGAGAVCPCSLDQSGKNNLECAMKNLKTRLAVLPPRRPPTLARSHRNLLQTVATIFNLDNASDIEARSGCKSGSFPSVGPRPPCSRGFQMRLG